MQDRFKFRVWDKIHERYIYCDFAGYCSVDYSGNGEKRIVFMPSGVEQIKNGKPLLYAKEDEAKIEQCTGLKDKNGKLIYEGDWLKTKDGYYCYVVWFEGFWWVKSLPSEAMDFEHSEFYGECEVVGNINENPDLMEVKDE